ncbi:MAG: S26 family signal peptidase, partial [Bacteroidetes bacterium]
MAILIFLFVSYILLSISLMKVFEKAGEPGWKALVPGLNFAVWARLVGHNPLHALWLLFPIVNIFIYAGLCVDLVRSFGKYRFWHSALAVIYAPVMFFMLGKNEEDTYLGPTLLKEKEYYQKIEEARAAGKDRQVRKLEATNPYRKGPVREWTEAIVFAVFAAAFIRMFLIEAYTIPTTSMEGSLKAGDFLFVSKWHYGIRTPRTIVMIPLLHNRIPILNTESYLDEPSLPMYRLPAWETVDRSDPVVFNFPGGDSVYVFPSRTWTVEDFRYNSVGIPQHYRAIKEGRAKLVTRPVDKRDHYIKRCIAVPGDSLEIRDRQVF